jgi:cell division septation protein DedD
VLVGTTFSSEKNARIFAADLRHRGFMAMTASVSSDSGVVYKVQVGAYRNRLSAEEAANQLQQSGYPAYIATDR